MAVLLGLLLLPSALAPVAAARELPPHVVLILIDDLGWTDLGSYGSTFHETPNLDRLASEGLRFTDAYAAAPVCSPTRASLLTGKSPARLRITNFIPGSGAPDGSPVVPPSGWVKALPDAEETLAERLKRAGYASGIFGKWHLGDPAPAEQGFEEDRSDGFWSWVRYWIPPILFDTCFVSVVELRPDRLDPGRRGAPGYLVRGSIWKTWTRLFSPSACLSSV